MMPLTFRLLRSLSTTTSTATRTVSLLANTSHRKSTTSIIIDRSMVGARRVVDDKPIITSTSTVRQKLLSTDNSYNNRQRPSCHYYATSTPTWSSSPFDTSETATTNTRQKKKKEKRNKKRFIPRKAAVQLTEQARTLFVKLLETNPTKDGILLDYHQSSSGEPRMVFSFKFVTKEDLTDDDEGVTLEVDDDGTPKTPAETWDDGRPKLYIHYNAFLKVLGATVDVNMDTVTPVLYDKEGFVMDPNN